MYKRYTWKDEVVVWLNERACHPERSEGSALPKSVLSHSSSHWNQPLRPLDAADPCSNRFQDERYIFWTNGHGPLARRVSVKCECVWEFCLKMPILSRFQTECRDQIISHTLAVARTDSGRTVHILDERAVWRINWQDCLAAMCGYGHTVCGYLTTPLPTPFFPSGAASR